MPIDAKGRFVKPYQVKIDFEITAKNITDLSSAAVGVPANRIYKLLAGRQQQPRYATKALN